MPQGLKAVFWDVDGTLAETEMDGHRLAFNAAFAEADLPYHWDPPTYRQLLAIAGGLERLGAYLNEVEGIQPSTSRLEQLQARKQAHYCDLVRGGGLSLRAGVARLIGEIAAAGITQAIVTTSGRSAVQALSQACGEDLLGMMGFWICGEDVSHKKPHPEAYRLAITGAGVQPDQVLVLEDSAQGLRAATAAGVSTLVTLSQVSMTEPMQTFELALAVLDGLGDGTQPAVCFRGPACPGDQVTLSYLERLLQQAANPDG